ncbi:transmembrane and coiled-coil domain-containing protein 3 isoform X3 [Hydra vulgaris]|uniref:Transmembrane and coiled-coil domain-containing protein 3 isoform X3 n=1 Tax=Hydra vulgaris TaxID=6087 RepID=A0ABM4B701_HYDVU
MFYRLFIFSYVLCSLINQNSFATTVNQANHKNICQRLKLDEIFLHKFNIDKKLAENIRIINENKGINTIEKQHKLQVVKLFQREMNVSVDSFFKSLQNFKRILRGNYQSIEELKEINKGRLEQLKSAMLDAEDEFNLIVDIVHNEELHAQKNLSNKKYNTIVEHFFKELISGVAVAADVLEEKLDDNAFGKEIHSKKIEIETVVKIDGNSNDNEGIVMLVDSDSNHYVLSKPRDGTTTHVDYILLKEILSLVVCTFLLTLVCSLLRFPFIFACILTGVILGPSGTAFITSTVQIETIGEFGVFFVLFIIGLEFSQEKLRKVIHHSLFGISGIIISLTVIGLFWGAVFNIVPKQTIFVTLCLSFTSTTMVTNMIRTQNSAKDHIVSFDEDYSSLLISMLFLQDVLLGIFMAALPILSGHYSDQIHTFPSLSGNNAVHSFLHGSFGGSGEVMFFTVIELLAALTGISFFAYVLSRYAAAKFFRTLNLFSSKESFLLGIISAMAILLMITEYFGISMELGCYLCGAVMSSMGEKTIHQVTNILEPLKIFFSVLFFASIGFHIFPTFLLSELILFVSITFFVMATKFFVCAGILHYILPKGNKSKWLVAAGLAQLSEFSFVLGSRAKRFGLIGREVYLIILSITTLSLFISPFMWRFVYWNVTKVSPWNLNLRNIQQKILS